MKNVLLSTAAVVCISGAAFGQSSGTEVIEAIDNGIAMMNSGESIFRFESREVGSDNSVTFNNVEFGPEDDEVGFTAEWVKATPSSTNDGAAIFTISDTIIMNIDEGDVPVVITINSDDFLLETNLINGLGQTPMLSLSADSITATGGAADHPNLQNFDFNATDLSVSFNFDMIARNIDAALDSGVIALDVAATEDDEQIEVVLKSDGMTMDFTAQNVPMNEDMIKGFVDNDGSFKLTASTGGQYTRINLDSSELPIKMTTEAGPGQGEVSMIDGRFLYKGEAGSIKYVIEPDTSVMPFPPFTISMDSAVVDVQIPLRPSEDDQEVVFDLALNELVIDDVLWMMADPAGNLPHEPANLLIDLGATVRIDQPLVESLDNDGVADLPIPFMVGQAKNIDINKVLLSVAGATIDIAGAFDVNNDGPIPMPLGKVDVSIKGVQAIANHLVSMGLIEQAQVGMAMGMMMAFMKQGSEPDSFSTVIDVTEDGVTANGTPLPF